MYNSSCHERLRTSDDAWAMLLLIKMLVELRGVGIVIVNLE